MITFDNKSNIVVERRDFNTATFWKFFAVFLDFKFKGSSATEW